MCIFFNSTSSVLELENIAQTLETRDVGFDSRMCLLTYMDSSSQLLIWQREGS